MHKSKEGQMPSVIFGKHTAKRPQFLLMDPRALKLTEYAKLIQDAAGWGIKSLRVNDNDYCALRMNGFWLIADNDAPEELMMFQLKYGHCILKEFAWDDMRNYMKLAKLREKQSMNSPKTGRKKKSIMDYMYTMSAIALEQKLPIPVRSELYL